MSTKTATPTIWHTPDDLWKRIAPVLGPDKAPGTPGRPATPARLIFAALVSVVRTGCQWQALPRQEYAPGSTVHGRFRQ
jgi:transposase